MAVWCKIKYCSKNRKKLKPGAETSEQLQKVKYDFRRSIQIKETKFRIIVIWKLPWIQNCCDPFFILIQSNHTKREHLPKQNGGKFFFLKVAREGVLNNIHKIHRNTSDASPSKIHIFAPYTCFFLFSSHISRFLITLQKNFSYKKYVELNFL